MFPFKLMPCRRHLTLPLFGPKPRLKASPPPPALDPHLKDPKINP